MELAAAPAVAAAAYYAVALLATLRRLHERGSAGDFLPPVSILKPIRGRDPHFFEAIHSHALLDYPEFEILFGASDPNDPAVGDIKRLIAEYPNRQIRLVLTTGTAPNRKVGVLSELASQARHRVLVVNDSDITVERDYLRHVVAPLEQPSVGLTTCLYRARSESWPAHFAALGVSTEFAPSVLVARLLGMQGFALGSTMAFRAEQLEQIGGFAAFQDYLADDYQLGQRIAQLGYRVTLAAPVVETSLGRGTWSETWRHQVRWARTVRVSRNVGYYGYVVTQATVWSVVAAIGGAWRQALACVAIRMLAGILAGCGVLRDRQVARRFFLIPFRDLFGFAVWIAGLGGNTVEWRGERLIIDPAGRILKP